MDSMGLSYTPAYTAGDYDILGTIKKAADLVFAYYRWVIEDHTRTLVSAKEEAKVEELILDLMATFGLDEDKAALARYFASNVLYMCVHADGYGTHRGFGFSNETLAEMFSQTTVLELMEGMSDARACMYAGRFYPENGDRRKDSAVATMLSKVRTAQIVGCDLIFVQTLSWQLLLLSRDIEDDTTFECVGRAIAEVDTEEQQLLDVH